MRNKNLYPENWNDEIRPAVLKRDNFKCCHCGIKHRSYIFEDQNGKTIIVNSSESAELRLEGYKSYRVYLQVAHKDHLKVNHSLENLFSLCPKCHRKYDRIFDTVLRIGKLVKPSTHK